MEIKRVIETATGRELYGTSSNECLPTETLVSEVRTFWCLKPYFNFDTREYYEGATQEELDEYNKSLVPEVVTKLQLKIQLTLSGFDLTLIDNAINQLPEPQRSLTSISWNDATLFERNNQLLISLATQLGLTSLDLDNIFISALNI